MFPEDPRLVQENQNALQSDVYGIRNFVSIIQRNIPRLDSYYKEFGELMITDQVGGLVEKLNDLAKQIEGGIR